MRRRTRHIIADPLKKTLDWDIELQPVYSKGEVATDYQGIHRNDNSFLLNIAKKTYCPATNEMLKETVAKIKEFTGFEVVGYSEYHQGRIILAYLKNPEPMRIGDFTTENYLVLGNSFDGSKSFFDGIVNQVLRCSNQFASIRKQHVIRHTRHIGARLDELALYYKKYMDQEAALKQTFETWCGIKVTPDLKEAFVNKILKLDNKDEISVVKTRQRQDLFHSINMEISAMGNNLYGLFNGLTHYSTHVRATTQKVFGNAIGSTYEQNNEGFNIIREYALSVI